MHTCERWSQTFDLLQDTSCGIHLDGGSQQFGEELPWGTKAAQQPDTCQVSLSFREAAPTSRFTVAYGKHLLSCTALTKFPSINTCRTLTLLDST